MVDYESGEGSRDREVIKCVVVGDTGVGKTRLICAKACDQTISLNQLLNVHTPTVWAIDRYRMCREILERSYDSVDGVEVSLRLWDTFGDHSNDRRFAYGRSDVILLCFSIVNPKSLHHARTVWWPEIRRMCPGTPVLVVGCKNDLRHLYTQPWFHDLVHEKRPFGKPPLGSELLYPEQGRLVAKEIGATAYYETSVLTLFGVHDLFRNAVRAALIKRRQVRFWMTTWDTVKPPQLQRPYLPPRPDEPLLPLQSSSYVADMRRLTACWPEPGGALPEPTNFPDCLLLLSHGSHQPLLKLWTHRLILAASSCLFRDLFSESSSVEIELPRTAPSTPLSGPGHLDWEGLGLLAKSAEERHSSSPQTPRSMSSSREREPGWFAPDSGNRLPPGVERVEVLPTSDYAQDFPYAAQLPPLLYVVHITPPPFSLVQDSLSCLRFMYSGDLPESLDYKESWQELAQFFDLPELQEWIAAKNSADEYVQEFVSRGFLSRRRIQLRRLGLEGRLFCDMEFGLEKSGRVGGHRALLSSRSEVMAAMLGGAFREGRERWIGLPGVSGVSLRLVQSWLYTDELEESPTSQSLWELLESVELANRLCLCGLRSATEAAMIGRLREWLCGREEEAGAADELLQLLPLAPSYNAVALTAWCLHFVASNYNKICRSAPKLVKALLPTQQDWLARHRWPPVWYLKELDHYERSMREKGAALGVAGLRRSHRVRARSGCLCFASRLTSRPTTPS